MKKSYYAILSLFLALFINLSSTEILIRDSVDIYTIKSIQIRFDTDRFMPIESIVIDEISKPFAFSYGRIQEAINCYSYSNKLMKIVLEDKINHEITITLCKSERDSTKISYIYFFNNMDELIEIDYEIKY